MKHLIMIMGIFTFLFGCSSKEIKKEDLIGEWECIKLNNQDPKSHGFTSIKMKVFPNDSLEVITTMNTFGEITTRSDGQWKIVNNVLQSNLGEHTTKSIITRNGNNIVFKPDPLFKSDMIKSSEYRRIK